MLLGNVLDIPQPLVCNLVYHMTLRFVSVFAYLQVVCSEDTLTALKTAQARGSSSWRVSSTVFGHIASDQVLTPLDHFATSQAAQQYPAIDAGKFVQQELEAIKLKQR